MQQRPGRVRAQGSASMRTKRTHPALPGATLPTAPIAARSREYLVEPQPTKRTNYGRRAIFQLLGLGICLELLFLAYYSLLAGAAPTNDAGKQALLGLFPWL